MFFVLQLSTQLFQFTYQKSHKILKRFIVMIFSSTCRGTKLTLLSLNLGT